MDIDKQTEIAEALSILMDAMISAAGDKIPPLEAEELPEPMLRVFMKSAAAAEFGQKIKGQAVPGNQEALIMLCKHILWLKQKDASGDAKTV